MRSSFHYRRRASEARQGIGLWFLPLLFALVAFVKGKKTGGRQKGTPNRLTHELRTQMVHFMTAYLEGGLIFSDLRAADGNARLAFFTKLMTHLIPRSHPEYAERADQIPLEDPFGLSDNGDCQIFDFQSGIDEVKEQRAFEEKTAELDSLLKANAPTLK